MTTFDHDEFDRARARWDLETHCADRAKTMTRLLFGTDDEQTFTQFRLAVELVVHSMGLDDPRPLAPYAPTHRPPVILTPDEDEFKDAMLEHNDGQSAYWPLYRARVLTFEATAAMTESEVLAVDEIGPVRLRIIRAVLAEHGYELRPDA